MEKGVYLVGAGPGDPELLTVKATRVLQHADCLVYDHLVGPAILDMVPGHCKKMYVGKQDGLHVLPQEEINELLAELVQDHRVVVRLKGGDPFIFGRGWEEASHLNQAGVPVFAVPGLSSCLAVPALAGVPVTMRGEASHFAVITGHNQSESIQEPDWAALCSIHTLVFLMGVKNRQKIARNLQAEGRPADDPVVFIENGSLPGQRLIWSHLEEVAESPPDVRTPAIMVIGPTARQTEKPLLGEWSDE